MNQYIILIHSGRFEGCSIANLTLFFLTEEERTPTDVANLLSDIFKEYLKDARYPEEAAESVKNLLSLITDTFDNDLYELLEENGFCFNPHKKLPIKKIINLSEMIDYLTERNCWYFKKENFNKHNNQISGEVFDTIWEDKDI